MIENFIFTNEFMIFFLILMIVFLILWVKKKKSNFLLFAWIIPTMFLMVFGVPYAINELYSLNSGYYTLWYATDVLSFYGDALSFLGTVVLGIIAVWQTKKANDISELSEKNNQKLLELQAYEYKPKLLLTSFVGITKFRMSNIGETLKNNPQMMILEMRTEENEVQCNYGVALHIDNSNMHDINFTRTYEIHIKYAGKLSIDNISLTSICFSDSNNKYEYNLDMSDSHTSLNDGDEIIYFVYLMGNGDIEDLEFIGRKLIECRTMILKYKLSMENGKEINAQTSITKHLIHQPEKHFNTPYVEWYVSANFKTEETEND